MLGRLSPAVEDRLQFFPEDWASEFPLAKELGFSYIQWFFDRNDKNTDPINDIWGDVNLVKKIDKARSVLPISSIDCGLYPMFGPEAERNIRDFKSIFPILESRLETRILSIPLLEKEAPKSLEEKAETAKNIKDLTQSAKSFGLKVALETEMPAQELLDYVNSLGESNVGVTYDIGNATSYGFACPREIELLGEKIFEVHLKDRKVGSSQSVLLGMGDASFDSCFRALKDINYHGIYTLQAWRGKDYLIDAKKQLNFVKERLNHIYEK